MDKYESRAESAVEQIGELRMRLKSTLAAGGEDFCTVVARDFAVKIEFTFHPGHPGHPGKLDGRFEDAEEPEPPELPQVTVKAIKADANVHFYGDGRSATVERGENLIALFTNLQIGALEDKLLAAKRAQVI